jgi:glucosamine-6-phosphate deaminase
MKVILTADRDAMGAWVAEHAAAELRDAIEARGAARLIIATGSSQFEVLQALAQRDDVDWSVVTGFHLDEYIGIAPDHPASFCGYLRERFVSRVPLCAFHYLDGRGDPRETIRQVGGLLTAAPIDVALVGIGENGHLAFNDPPADFESEAPYLIVELDQQCRAQQVGEGWFPNLEAVPTNAISMSIRQILRTGKIFCSVPDQRKAAAVRATLEDPISPQIPASILRRHNDTVLIIDRAAASDLSEATLRSVEVV